MSREKKWTTGPWKACHNGKCKCKQVWSETADHPITMVESGNVGDDYPAIVDGSAVMEQITYWHINEDTSQSNAALISAAPELVEALEHQCLSCENKLLCADCVIGRALAKAYGETA